MMRTRKGLWCVSGSDIMLTTQLRARPILQILGRSEESLKHLEKALEMYVMHLLPTRDWQRQRAYPTLFMHAHMHAETPVCVPFCARSYRRVFPNRDRHELARVTSALAMAYERQGRMKEAMPLFVAGLESQRRMFDGDHNNVAIALFSVRKVKCGRREIV